MYICDGNKIKYIIALMSNAYSAVRREIIESIY